MKKLYYTALGYMIIGLASGVLVRLYVDQIMHFEGETRLQLLHFHILVLGMIFMLVVMALEKAFQLSQAKRFTLFYWHYNGGLLLTLLMMIVIGVMQVNGHEPSGMTEGIAGLGHIILAAGLGFFFNVLYERVVK